MDAISRLQHLAHECREIAKDHHRKGRERWEMFYLGKASAYDKTVEIVRRESEVTSNEMG